jgi:hypothetical protein
MESLTLARGGGPASLIPGEKELGPHLGPRGRPSWSRLVFPDCARSFLWSTPPVHGAGGAHLPAVSTVTAARDRRRRRALCGTPRERPSSTPPLAVGDRPAAHGGGPGDRSGGSRVSPGRLASRLSLQRPLVACPWPSTSPTGSRTGLVGSRRGCRLNDEPGAVGRVLPPRSLFRGGYPVARDAHPRRLGGSALEVGRQERPRPHGARVAQPAPGAGRQGGPRPPRSRAPAALGS